ncbi:Ger(x)C family spore germination protein [Dethiothermospora halolimnae]|uniref:Ger(x)C family spore germination protein n=1 Tax=Dethiothermospora halolimnae TaxID=3114390 RepID=UPI003CCC3023
MIKFRKIIFLIIINLMSMFILAGCWDNVDLTKQAFVVGVGLDKTKEGKLELTLQIVKPSTVASKEGPSTGDKPVWVYSTEGHTIFEAVRKQLETINRKPFYSHAQIIVIGESLAKDGIQESIDFFERDVEPRLTSSVLVAKGTTAKEILKAKSGLEDIPAMHFKEILQNEKNNLNILNIKLIDILEDLSYPAANPVIASIDIVKRNKVLSIKDTAVKGCGVFKRDKLVGWLDTEGTKGMKYIKNKSKDGIINVENPLNNKLKVAIEQLDSETEIDVNIDNEGLKFTIGVEGKGNIGGQQGTEDLTSSKQLKSLEEEVQNKIKSQIEHVVNEAQKNFKSDILGLGLKVSKKYPYYWDELKKDWSKAFGKADIKVDVKFNIVRTGLISHPTDIK